eukprot:Gb_12149 [translate_table: standard]
MAQEANCMYLRLLISKKTQRILYAEAGKDFVDLLFSFLLLPTGAVIKLFLDNKYPDKVACLTNLYKSVEKLPQQYMSDDKSELLQPNVGSFSSNLLAIQEPSEATPVTDYYVCRNAHHHFARGHNVTYQRGLTCVCAQPLDTCVSLKIPVETVSATKNSGYVKDTVTFIRTDDLSISTTSTVTSIALLNKQNLRDLTDLEERNVTVGFHEALELLAAAMVSKTALNDVFSVESPSAVGSGNAR